MAEETLQSVKDKINKLFALGNDPGAFEGERDNALRFARRYMLRHNLTEADLTAPRDPHEAAADEEYAQSDAWSYGERTQVWESLLLRAICKLVGTVGYYVTKEQEKRRTAHGTVEITKYGTPRVCQRSVFYGPAADVRDASALFHEWSEVIAATARLKHGGFSRGDGRAYAEGFASGLLDSVLKVTAEEQALLAKPTGTDLVLRSQLSLMQAKKQRGAEWLKNTVGISLKSAGRREIRSGDAAFGEGFTDGKKSELKRERTLRLPGRT